MVTKQDLYDKALKQLGELGETDIDTALLDAIAGRVPKTGLDATLISGSDESELDYVVKNFMAKKLGETDAEAGRAKLNATIQRFAGINHKQRAAAYYLLVKEYGAEAAYAA